MNYSNFKNSNSNNINNKNNKNNNKNNGNQGYNQGNQGNQWIPVNTFPQNQFGSRNDGLNTFPNGNFPPFGYNDNNFNRNNFPSNLFPPNGGLKGNPNSNYNYLSTNSQNNLKNNTNKFDKAYRQHDPIIESIDYTNNKKLLYNNISENVLDEHIVEYRINIDSLDRDVNVYHSPFNFTVKFNPPSGGKVRTEVLEKGSLKTVNDTFEGPPKPHINKEFRNVKYIKLDNIILPQYSSIMLDDRDYDVDPSSNLVDDRFISLVIKELDCNRVFCTADGSFRTDPDTGAMVTPPRPFAHIFPDKLLGRIYYTGTPYYGSKVYKSSLLGNINSLTIQLYNSCGTPLKFDNFLTAQQLHKAKCNNEEVDQSDIRHPLNKNFQIHLSFIVGVVESQINNHTKFEQS